MTLIVFVATGFVIALIAVVAVGAVVSRLSVQAPVSVFDEDEAVDWIADRLPFEVASQLSPDDVRSILIWHLDYLEQLGAATESGYATPDSALVVDDDGLAYVLGQATDAGLDVEDVHVVAVLEAEQGYLEAIGAIGPPVSD
ncbi:MAG: hypothetical protein WCK41_02135 [Actinomycetes bacterium]